MTLGDMCLMAARYADRHDEFIKTGDRYQGEALNMFCVMRDAINEAYTAIAAGYLLPDCRILVTPDSEGCIDLNEVLPRAAGVLDVFTADGRVRLPFSFLTRFQIAIERIKPGEEVLLHAHILPQPLENETDEPVFPETTAAPMIYAALAAARLLQSERKFSDAQYWMNEYHRLIRGVRSSGRSVHRLKRPSFR